ncbi:hypothetical protein GCM10020331_070300 [Ectobacillus funiculus]
MDDWLDVREDSTGPGSIYELIHPEEREMCKRILDEGLESISSPVSIETKWIGKRKGKVCEALCFFHRRTG